MAAGDIQFFNQAKVDLGNKIFDLDTDTFKVAFITAAMTPAVANAAPHWDGTGTTNFRTAQVTPGGNYADNGAALGNVTYADNAGTAEWKASKISIAQHASNPTNARWGILFDNTDANKRAVAFLDLGTTVDMTQGLFEFKFNSVDGVGTIATLA